MSLDITSIRLGIAQVVRTIPEIITVEPYAKPATAANNLPAAMIFREHFSAPSIHQADTELGHFDANMTWTLRVYANLSSIDQAQEFHDLLTVRLTSAFDGAMLIDPNGPGIVDESRITYIAPIMQDEDHPAVWITEATLQTFNTFIP